MPPIIVIKITLFFDIKNQMVRLNTIFSNIAYESLDN